MNPPQEDISNNVNESNITGFINNCNNLPQTTATTTIQAEHSSNINCCDDPSCSYNNGFSVKDNNIFPAHTSVDHNNYQQPMSNSTSNNNDIISPDHNYQRPISNDASPNHNYQQSMPNNASTPQFYPQYIDQNLPQSSVFSLLNSLGMITINSPQTNIIIMPVTSSSTDIRNFLQQDHTYSNNSSSNIADNSQT